MRAHLDPLETNSSEMKKGKAKIWEEVHSAKTQCPHCHKTMAVRQLRWKHTCGHKRPPQILLDTEAAEKRRRELEQKVVATLNARLQQRAEDPRPK